jgi:transcriptional regulator with XRE-family HTH domain
MKEAGAEEFWGRFDKQRKSVGISIKALTEKLGLSYPLLITQRSRNIYPPVLTACKIAKFLGTTVEYLATGEQVSVDLGQGDGSSHEEQKLIPLDVVLAMSPLFGRGHENWCGESTDSPIQTRNPSDRTARKSGAAFGRLLFFLGHSLRFGVNPHRKKRLRNEESAVSKERTGFFSRFSVYFV